MIATPEACKTGVGAPATCSMRFLRFGPVHSTRLPLPLFDYNNYGIFLSEPSAMTISPVWNPCCLSLTVWLRHQSHNNHHARVNLHSMPVNRPPVASVTKTTAIANQIGLLCCTYHARISGSLSSMFWVAFSKSDRVAPFR